MGEERKEGKGREALYEGRLGDVCLRVVSSLWSGGGCWDGRLHTCLDGLIRDWAWFRLSALGLRR
jgi:hypothetical protein